MYKYAKWVGLVLLFALLSSNRFYHEEYSKNVIGRKMIAHPEPISGVPDVLSFSLSGTHFSKNTVAHPEPNSSVLISNLKICFELLEIKKLSFASDD